MSSAPSNCGEEASDFVPDHDEEVRAFSPWPMMFLVAISRFLRFERSPTLRSSRVSTPATRFRNSQPRYKTPALYLRTVSHEPNASHRQLHHARVQCTVLTYVTTMLLMRYKHSATCCNLHSMLRFAQIPRLVVFLSSSWTSYRLVVSRYLHHMKGGLARASGTDGISTIQTVSQRKSHSKLWLLRWANVPSNDLCHEGCSLKYL
jgi:hypothetical protein